MESIRIQELREAIRDNSIYASMFGIVAFLTLIMDLFPTDLVLINSLVLAITIVSFIALIYVVFPLARSINELKKVKLILDECYDGVFLDIYLEKGNREDQTELFKNKDDLYKLTV